MKKRLDIAVFEKNLAPSREKAKLLIMEGKVFVDGIREDKPGANVGEDAKIELRGQGEEFVSRGGRKLKKALEVFPIDLSGLICMDIGASTGGFTDCMLRRGAAKVYSIDVGYGQLDWSLRNDDRVVVMERVNFRYLTPSDIGEEIDFASCDVSFISLRHIFPAAYPMLSETGQMVALIKPQFEAGKKQVGKHGVVRDPEVHRSVILSVLGLARESGFFPAGLSYSPIKGPEGNIEYLLYLTKTSDQESWPGDEAADLVVESAHKELSA